MPEDLKEKKEEKLDNVTHIDEMRKRRLATKGHLPTMLEEFEMLRLKFLYNQDMKKEEAIKLITLCKYFMENGPSEPFRYQCKLMYEKYMGKHDL